jgi:hypothetical protein
MTLVCSTVYPTNAVKHSASREADSFIVVIEVLRLCGIRRFVAIQVTVPCVEKPRSPVEFHLFQGFTISTFGVSHPPFF